MLLLRDIPISLYYPGGKLTLSQRQNAYEEESEAQAQLTNIELPTQEANTLPSTSASVTDSDGQQSASERVRNPKLSTDSVDSGMGRNSSHNSSSKLLQQDDECAVGQNERLVQIEQSISELKQSFAKAMDVLAEQVRSVKLQSVGSNEPSIAISESTDHKASSSSLLLESNTGEAEMKQDHYTHSDKQATAGSQSEAPSIDEPEQQRKRHYSDSKMTRYRKSEIRNKLGSVVPKALSEQINVSTQVEILPYKTDSEVLQCVTIHLIFMTSLIVCCLIVFAFFLMLSYVHANRQFQRMKQLWSAAKETTVAVI